MLRNVLIRSRRNGGGALLARGLAEIIRLGDALGARPETFAGIAGVGDLATTCFCPEGRNRTCGEAIGRGVPLDLGQFERLRDKWHLEATASVVEGVATCRAMRRLAAEQGVAMPITDAVHAVLFEGVAPEQALEDLMRRDVGAEVV